MPDLPRTIELAVGIPGRIDLEAQGGIRSGPGRSPVGVTHDRPPVIIGGRGELRSRVHSDQWRSPAHPADRLDPIHLAMFINEIRHLRNGRSSSAWAKYAFASGLEPMAPALAHPSSGSHWTASVPGSHAQARSPLGSNQWRLNGSLRAISTLVGPGRSPPSRWTCRIQTRRLSGEQPNLPAIAVSSDLATFGALF